METHAAAVVTLSPEPLLVVCAWCPDFDPTARSNDGASHTICPVCEARLNAELDAAGV